MAPFVAPEWGDKATAMMWRIKQLADPSGILAPDVILTRNPNLHLENLKSFPQIEGVTGSSQCIECGFCEPVCPSRNVTMTPRQRIALRREMSRQKGDSAMLAQLQEEYQYDGISRDQNRCVTRSNSKKLRTHGADRFRGSDDLLEHGRREDFVVEKIQALFVKTPARLRLLSGNWTEVMRCRSHCVVSLTDFRASALLGETPNGDMPEVLNGKSLEFDF